MFTKMLGKISGAPYEISQSCMYDSVSATRNRRNAIGAASTQGVLSVWVKRTAITGVHQGIYSSEGATAGNNNFYLRFTNADQLAWLHDQGGTIKGQMNTVRVFRDCSSWYHIFLWIDTNEVGGNDDRLKMYVNGVLQTLNWSDSLPFENALNFCRENSAFGYRVENDTGYFNGYMSQAFYLHDGVLDISNFGEFRNGLWVPKDLTALAAAFDDADSASFFLDFADSSVLGNDVGAHGNDFSQANMAADHQVSDSPTQNYCTFNYPDTLLTMTSRCPEGALRIGQSTATWVTGAAGFLMKTGKWYWEVDTTSDIQYLMNGIIASGEYSGDYQISSTYLGQFANGFGIATGYNPTRQYVGAVNTNSTNLGLITTDDIIQVAFDADANKLWFGINNVWSERGEGTPNPATGTNPFYDSADGIDAARYDYVPAASAYQHVVMVANFGQRTFAYTPPTGFQALCTNNLPEPAIIEPSDAFDVVLYTGSGAEKAITDLSFQPDLVWIKNRDTLDPHHIFDSARGATKWWETDGIAAEQENAQTLKSFDANGFTLGTDGEVNTNTEDFVAWCLKEGAAYGFDIVTYVGTGANRTVAHSLGVAPELMIIKLVDTAQSSTVYHHHALNKTDPETDYAVLDTSAAWADNNTFWNDTAPTSAVFSLGVMARVNYLDHDHIAYLFASIAGFSHVFSYYGNQNASGPYIY